MDTGRSRNSDETAEDSPDLPYPYLEEALPGFHRAREVIKAGGDTLRPLDLRGSKFDFYRFANRFRLAISLESLDLAGFERETADGYAALTRVFMMWSAFERYADMADCPPPYAALMAQRGRMELSALCDTCQRHDRQWQLWQFLFEEAAPIQQDNLRRYREGDRRSVWIMAACIRHIYVHGHLTAHPNRCKAGDVITICDALHGFLRDVIQTDLQRRTALAEAAARRGNSNG